MVELTFFLVINGGVLPFPVPTAHLYLFREMSFQDLESRRWTLPPCPRVIFRATVENLAKDQGQGELVAPAPYPPAFPCSPQGF